MDLNPLFTSPTAFRPAGDNGALELFEKANIPLVHGWLVDPSSSREYSVLSETEDYDASVNLLVEADSLSSGQLVVDENGAGPSSAGSSAMHANLNISEEGKKKIEDGKLSNNNIYNIYTLYMNVYANYHFTQLSSSAISSIQAATN